MTSTTAKAAAAAVVAAVLLLTGCGTTDAAGDRVAPGAQSTSVSGGNPNEHLGHRDVEGATVAGNPNEHLAHRGQ